MFKWQQWMIHNVTLTYQEKKKEYSVMSEDLLKLLTLFVNKAIMLCTFMYYTTIEKNEIKKSQWFINLKFTFFPFS